MILKYTLVKSEVVGDVITVICKLAFRKVKHEKAAVSLYPYDIAE